MNNTEILNKDIILASQIVGYIAGVSVIILNIPQIYIIIKNKSSKNVSLFMIILNLISGALFLTYGILINQLPIIICNILYLLVSIILLICKIVIKN